MCTVTFIPSGNSFYFTSSRDEQAGRLQADFPEIREINGKKIMYPRDPQGGGSWIAVSETGNTAILLNGAMRGHIPRPPYRKSRGLILLDLVADDSPADAFEKMRFEGIEPFTVILFDDQKLYCGKWDGMMKWIEPLAVTQPYIWSSVTLYDPEAIRRRESWFKKWIQETPYPGSLDIFHFHQKGGDGDPFNDILMNRQDLLFTNSISSVRLSADAAHFRYLDLRSGLSGDYFMPVRSKITFSL